MTVDLTGHESYASLNSALASKMGLSQSPKWKPVPPELLPQKLKARDVQILSPQGNVLAKVEEAWNSLRALPGARPPSAGWESSLSVG